MNKKRKPHRRVQALSPPEGVDAVRSTHRVFVAVELVWRHCACVTDIAEVHALHLAAGEGREQFDAHRVILVVFFIVVFFGQLDVTGTVPALGLVVVTITVHSTTLELSRKEHERQF